MPKLQIVIGRSEFVDAEGETMHGAENESQRCIAGRFLVALRSLLTTQRLGVRLGGRFSPGR
jgi:hypothetical protein